jgi:hypothetical protein
MMHCRIDLDWANKVTKYFFSVRQQRDGSYNIKINPRYRRVINKNGLEHLLTEAIRIIDNALFYKATYERSAEMLGTRTLDYIIAEIHALYQEWKLSSDAFEYYHTAFKDEAILDAGKVLRVTPTGDEILTLDTYVSLAEEQARWKK